MLWRLIIKDFGPNIQHIAGVDNIVSDAISILPSMTRDKYTPCTSKGQCRANKLFAICRIEKNKDFLLLNLLIVQREQKKELININSKLSTYISGRLSGYSRQSLGDIEII